jgi:DNA-binding transcriptional ArsR family regulator
MTPEQRALGSRIFAALASPARLHILEHLANGPASVNDIAEATGLKQSAASQHLSALLNAGAVVRRANGNMRLYSLRGPRIPRILQLVEEFYEAHLESLREILAEHTERGMAYVGRG